MSNLPEINHQKVANKLAFKLSEATIQIAQLESLAESLRDERDKAREDLETFKQELNTEE